MGRKHAHRWFWGGGVWECYTCPETRAWNSPEERDRLMRELASPAPEGSISAADPGEGTETT